MDQLAEIYVNTMNTIHYMHDSMPMKRGQMALHDPHVHRYIAFAWRDCPSPRIPCPPLSMPR